MTITTPYPRQWAAPMHSIDTVTSGWISWQQGAVTETAWGTANRAVYVPIRVPTRCTIKEIAWASFVTAAGNCDIGLYNAAGTRLVSAGSTANTTASTLRSIDVTDTVVIPGLYYIGLNNSTTTDTFYTTTFTAPVVAGLGVLTEALGSVTLPATATWVIDQTLTFIPVVSALLITEV